MTINIALGRRANSTADFYVSTSCVVELVAPYLPSPRPDFSYNQSLVCFVQTDEYSPILGDGGLIEFASQHYFEHFPQFHYCLQVLSFTGNEATDLLQYQRLQNSACGVRHASDPQRLRTKSVFNVAELKYLLCQTVDLPASFLVRLLFLEVDSPDSQFHVNFTANFYLLRRETGDLMRQVIVNCFKLLRQKRFFTGYASHVATSFFSNYLNDYNIVLNIAGEADLPTLHLDYLPPLLIMGKKEQITRQLAKNRQLQEQILICKAELEALERLEMRGDEQTEKLVLRLWREGMQPQEIQRSIDVQKALGALI